MESLDDLTDDNNRELNNGSDMHSFLSHLKKGESHLCPASFHKMRVAYDGLCEALDEPKVAKLKQEREEAQKQPIKGRLQEQYKMHQNLDTYLFHSPDNPLAKKAAGFFLENMIGSVGHRIV